MLQDGRYVQSTLMMPTVGLSRAAKAFGKRSRWLVPQPGHWSTIWDVELGYILLIGKRGDEELTMARMELPLGPVTEIHWPQWAALSQFELESAVP